MGLISRPNIQIYTYFQSVAPNITPANLPELVLGPNYQVVSNALASPASGYSPAFGLTTAYINQAVNTVADPTTVNGSCLNGTSTLALPWIVFQGTGALLTSSANTVSFSSTQALSIVPALSAEGVAGDVISITNPVGIAGLYTISAYSWANGLSTVTLTPGTLPAAIIATASDVSFSILAQSVTATSSTVSFPKRYTMLNPTPSGQLTGTIAYSGSTTTITTTSAMVTGTLGYVALISGSFSGSMYQVYPVISMTSSTLVFNYTAPALTSTETVSFKQVNLNGSVSGTVYESYKALNQFQQPIVIGSITDINTYLYGVPATPSDNPLALAAEFALANGITPVTVFGVPTDTMAGYQAVETQIHSNNIYVTVPLTQDLMTQQALATYVNSLNQPGEAQAERRLIVTPAYNNYIPVISNVSGTVQDNGTTTTFVFNGTLSPAPIVGNYLQVLSGNLTGDYLVSGVTISGGSTILTSTSHIGLNNIPVTGNIVATMTASQKATWLASYGQLFNSTQVNSLVWDSFISILSGTSYTLPMYYAASGLGAMIASLPPQQQFNGLSIAGVSSIIHSNTDLFSLADEDVIAGGGNIMLISSYNGGPVIIRNQLNTSVGTIQTESLNIVKDIDYVKRLIRANVSNFLIATNATQTELPYISASVDGIINYCKKQSVPNAGPILEFGSVNSINLVNDGVNIDVTLKAPYPLNTMTFNLFVM